jgi:hypothetical protein
MSGREQEDSMQGQLPGSDFVSILSFTDWYPRYRNNVTGEHQLQPPPPFRGGIMADQMGLGKTLQMIALVASDLEKHSASSDLSEQSSELASTLIVVPLPLLETWTDQLECHMHSKSMKWLVYHGGKRKSMLSSLSGFNIILTTYETVVSDEKKSSHPGAAQKSLFSFAWRRIILDEGWLTPRLAIPNFSH